MGAIITKQKYTNYVVNKFCSEMNIDRSTMTPEQWIPYIIPNTNTTLAICLEYLGLLDDRGLHYMAFRSDGVHIDPSAPEIDTVRKYIESLPDDEIQEKEIRRLTANNNTLQEIVNMFKAYNLDGYHFNINDLFEIDHVNKTISSIKK